MTIKNLERETSALLVERFLQLAVAKGQAMMGDETAKANRIYWQIDAIINVLKSRTGDDRRLLTIFYRHPDPSVRLEAATATLAVEPIASRLVLKGLWDRDEFPFAGHAGMLLNSLDTGRYKPT